MTRLSGKVAIVTGAAQGIGAVYAKGLAAEGALVSLCDLEEPKETVKAIVAAGGRAIGSAVDVSDRAAVATLIERTLKEFGGIHVLVNNAAIFGGLRPTHFTEIDPAEWDRVMAVNVRGSMECARAVVPAMRRQRYGKIINIASSTVFRGTPMLMHYVASKGAVIGMTHSMARELGDDGICVNCIAPGLTMSEAVRNSPNGFGSTVPAAVSARALKREQMPEDLLGAVIFLASSDSDFVTGQTMIVDGGTILQ
jgi:NAD(P)-dependent dehydrogenase (short-subunit alcohol dehydrogenase family)